MNAEAIREYEDAVKPLVAKLFERLSDQAYKVVDIGEWFNYFSWVHAFTAIIMYLIPIARFDFSVEVAFGGGSYMLNKGDSTNLWEAMDKFAL